MYRDAVDSLRVRFAKWKGGDASAILAQSALADHRLLLETLRDPALGSSAELRAEVLEMAARLCWYHYLSLENTDIRRETDRQLALQFMGELADDSIARPRTFLSIGPLRAERYEPVMPQRTRKCAISG